MNSDYYAQQLHAMVGGEDALHKDIFGAQFGGDIGDDGSSAAGVSVKAIETNYKDLTQKQMYELSVAVNCCNAAICRNVAGCKVRLFDREEREITGGELFNLLRRPNRKQTMRSLITDMVTWWNITGEMGGYKEPGDNFRPRALHALDPTRLVIERPSNPAKPEDILQWRYTWPNGASETIRADWLMFERMFNPHTPLRGLSPLITASSVINTAHGAWKYNKEYFVNGAIPSHILNLGEGVGRGQRQDIEKRYRQEFGTANGNAHKVLVVSGKGVSIEDLEKGFQEGSFIGLMDKTDEKVSQIYRVPAVEAYFLAKTRFDTAFEERKMFVQTTIQPIADLITDVFQTQLVDPHFSFSEYDRRREKLMTKGLHERFEQAYYERPDSNIIVLLDTDTLPLMAEVKAGMISAAKELGELLQMSANEIADYFDFDIPHRKERDEVWVARTKICVTNPQLNGEIMGAEMVAKQLLNSVAPAKADEDTDGDGDKPSTQTKPKKTAAVKTLLHKLRRPILSALDDGRLFGLDDVADLASDDAALLKTIRIVRNRLRPSLNADDPHAAAREILKELDPADLAGELE